MSYCDEIEFSTLENVETLDSIENKNILNISDSEEMHHSPSFKKLLNPIAALVLTMAAGILFRTFNKKSLRYSMLMSSLVFFGFYNRSGST